MKSKFLTSLVFCFGLAVGFTVDYYKFFTAGRRPSSGALSNLKVDTKKGTEVEFVEYGVRFFGKVNFDCGDGELSAVTDLNRVHIIPIGAVLLATKRDYLIGSYEGSVTVIENGHSKQISRILFSISSNGVIEYFHPSAEPKFIGKRIDGKVIFE